MKQIVIIEDNAKIREAFAEVINSTGKYMVTGRYSNCEAAIAALKEDNPDVVLMDIDLPGMTGIEGTGKIKKLSPACIVIIITVFQDSDKVFRSLCAGASGYLVKNANTETIISNIDEALAGGAPMTLHIAKMVVQSFARQNDSPLSERETEVLKGISQGKSYSKIALDLFISGDTVRSHIKNIYHKLAVNSKAEALKIAESKKWLG